VRERCRRRRLECPLCYTVALIHVLTHRVLYRPAFWLWHFVRRGCSKIKEGSWLITLYSILTNSAISGITMGITLAR